MRYLSRREGPFRSHIYALIFVTLIPLGLFGSALIVYLARAARQNSQQGLDDSTRALSLAVDRDLLNSIYTLKAVAASEFLDTGQLRQFYFFSKRIQANQPSWRNIILHDRSGRSLINLHRPFGYPLRNVLEPESFREVLHSQRPAVRKFVVGPTAQPSTAVRVPVIRDGEVKYVLSAILDLKHFAEILKAQELPASWVITVLDQERRILARTHDFEKFVGNTAADLDLALPAGLQGWIRQDNQNGGVATYTSFRKSPLSDWSVAITVPASELDQPYFQSVGLFVGLGMTSLAAAFALGYFVTRRINSSVTLVTGLVKTLGYEGKIDSPPYSAISEVNEITCALLQTSELLEQRAAERDQSEENTRNLNAELEKRVEKRTAALRQANDVLARQAELLDLSHDAIVVRGFDNPTIQFWSKGATALYGWTKEEATGKILPELLGTRYPEHIADIIAKLTVAGRWEGELVHTRKDGSKVVVLSRWSLRRNADGSPSSILQLNCDVTARKLAEKKAEESERMATLGTTAAIFAHEIGNPLNDIGLTLQYARKKIETIPRDYEAVNCMIEDVTHDIHRLGALLHEFRFFARPQILRLETVDIRELIDKVAASLRTTCDTTGVRIKIDLDYSLPLVRVDSAKMTQVFLNLFKNAIEAMPDGGTLAVTGHSATETVVVEVKDTGCGIAEGQDVFELFATTKESGTGLGLSVVRQIVSAHGGAVEYTTELGKGTTFKVCLQSVVGSNAQPVRCA